MTVPTTIGVDVGGTKLLAVALDHPSGEVRASLRRPTGRGAGALLQGMVGAVGELTRQLGLDPRTPVGVGVAGLVDHHGVLRHGPNQPPTDPTRGQRVGALRHHRALRGRRR